MKRNRVAEEEEKFVQAIEINRKASEMSGNVKLE